MTDSRTPNASAADVTSSLGSFTTSRRNLLRAGGLGLLGATVLAACGDKDEGGISGTPAEPTSVPPTVPTTEPSDAAREEDAVQLRTARSVELLAADVYREFGPKLMVEEWKANAERFAVDHEAAADVYAEGADETPESAEPNAYLMENFVDPAREGLTTDASILNFFYQLENLITANALNAVAILTEADWRQQTMAFGAASARRAAVLGHGGEGFIPEAERFPLTDLMPVEAFLVPTTTIPTS